MNPNPNPYAGRELWAFDTETWLIQPGLLAPPLVCGSWATEHAQSLTDKCGAVETFQTVLKLKGAVLVGHNLAYDIGVVCAADPTLVPLVFAKYDRGEVFDTLIAEQLIQIHEGTLGQGHSTSGSGGFSLAELGAKYLGSDREAEKSGPDAWRLRYAELDGVPLEDWPEAAKAYPIRDARETYDVAVAQIADGRNLWDLPAQCRAHLALHLSSMWGIRTDPEWVEKFTVKVTAEHSRTRAHFLSAGLLKVNRCTKEQAPDEIDVAALNEAISYADALAEQAESGAMKRMLDLEKALEKVKVGKAMRYGTDKKALVALVTEAYKGEPPTSAKGNVKTNKDTLWESGDALLEEFADAQENEKFFSTYLKVLEQGTHTPINPRVNVLVDTGRCSYSKPNLQNLPRGSDAGKPREGFVSRAGTVFASCDYPTLELRTLAYALEALGLESEMAKALRHVNRDGSIGIDLHEKLGAVLAGVELDVFQSWKKAPDKALRTKYKAFRQMAKAANFGLPGGLGAVKLVAFARASGARFCELSGRADVCGVEKVTKVNQRGVPTTVCTVCLAVAEEIKAAWFRAWPEMERYFVLVKSWLRETITVQDEDGMPEDIRVGAVTQLVSGRVRGRCNFTNGANTIFQGLAADVAKRALWLVCREMYTDPTSPLWGCRILVFIHDEIFAELPVERAAAGAERICRLMEQAFAEFCGGIPCDVEPALAWRWYKDAFTVRDERHLSDAGAPVVPVEKCPACAELQPVGWDGLILKHDGKNGVCAAVGKQHPVAISRGLTGVADISAIG